MTEFPEARPVEPSSLVTDTFLSGPYTRVAKINESPFADRALQMIVPYLKEDNPDPRAFEEAFQIHFLWGKEEKATDYARQAYERGSTAPGILLHLAWYQNQNLPRYPREPISKERVIALSDFTRKILDMDPTNRHAWRILLKVCGYSGMKFEYKEDIEYLGGGAALLDSDPEAQLAYAIILSKTPYKPHGKEIVEKVLHMEHLGEDAEAHANWLLDAVF